MRIASLACLLVLTIACSEGDAPAVNAPESGRLQTGQFRSANGPPATLPGQAQHPVTGAGTPGQLALWFGNSTLTDAPIRVDASGNLILKPGTAIYVISADGTRCFEIRGEFIRNNREGCPVAW